MFARIALGMVLLSIGACAFGAEVFRWVDNRGVTHYGEEPPAGSSPERAFTMPDTETNSNPEDDYFSVVNQSRRMEESRLAREKARSDARTAARSNRPQQPGVVYLDGDGIGRGYGYDIPPYVYPRPPIGKRPNRRAITDCRTTFIGCRKTLPPNPDAFPKRQIRPRRSTAQRPSVRAARSRGPVRP